MITTKEHALSNLNTLIASKTTIEDEIKSQAAILRTNNSTLDSPLTDEDGFPRADIDVWAVRHARVKIIRLRNDLTSLVDKIATALECVHASQPGDPESGGEIPQFPCVPFAKVDAVAPNSPAQVAGLHPGDLIVKFGPLASGDIGNSLRPVAQQVERNENRPILLSLSRNDQLLAVQLTPRRGWGGRGMLGCHIVPYTTQ